MDLTLKAKIEVDNTELDATIEKVEHLGRLLVALKWKTYRVLALAFAAGVVIGWCLRG